MSPMPPIASALPRERWSPRRSTSGRSRMIWSRPTGKPRHSSLKPSNAPRPPRNSNPLRQTLGEFSHRIHWGRFRVRHGHPLHCPRRGLRRPLNQASRAAGKQAGARGFFSSSAEAAKSAVFAFDEEAVLTGSRRRTRRYAPAAMSAASSGLQGSPSQSQGRQQVAAHVAGREEGCAGG